MEKRLNQLVDSCKGVSVNPRFFLGDEKISMKPDDYLVRAARKNGPNPLPQGKIMFNPNFTEYAVILQAQKKGGYVDAAVAGFNIHASALDCLQIQGGKSMFRELAPIMWDKAVLENLIRIGLKSKAEAVMVVPYRKVECDPSVVDFEKIEKRYDMNACSFGFRYSRLEDRFVLELSKISEALPGCWQQLLD